MENAHCLSEIYLQVVHFPASYVSLPERNHHERCPHEPRKSSYIYILSIESWLFDSDSYNGLLQAPYKLL